MDIVNIALIGATGRFSADILNEIEHSKGFLLSNAVTREGNQHVGRSVSLISEYKKTNVVISDNFNKVNEADVIIDVTMRDAFMNSNSGHYKKLKKPLVIATTAFTDEDLNDIQELSHSFPILMAANFSVDIYIFIEKIREIVKRGGIVKAEIVEKHHKYKLDAPSGTALKIDEIIREADEKTEIEISSIREGDIIGEHYVTLYNALGETIQLSHQLESRRDLTKGILMAAAFIATQPNGLYTVEDLMTNVLSNGK
ncbi:hypothetical protein R70723_07815 [Paenibacillus sp. FSL R7-0273]|uniref:4-hydroxy-tetrahydrodipicolinate reductase n=1 Tax=Paenibacillus sp. FSL R7-0273 TaxID=1536772 RepID=UPI0004F76154|nr:4-hydroxy-tetrahydrodipicolinate reductase [Paenibacillus sp. FSL R7-0273]AIQ45796.1 hypothetical protein R70723_07815 [Paenibacillus sp. FSL R7-0273]OMF95323.1 4-hydroxy-tetrahydrodipicolinate reductase [Paenibacillus sp. FSL R7-0273]